MTAPFPESSSVPESSDAAPHDLPPIESRKEIVEGSASIELTFRTGDGPLTLPVWYHRPAGFSPDSPILFVMHGVLRNAAEYRDTWAVFGERHGALILAPEFSNAQFRGSKRYNLGRLSRRHTTGTPKRPTSFALIDWVFEVVRALVSTRQAGYRIFGHSAGAQFVHRLVMFEPAPKVEVALAANAGWYTLPAWDETFPYGLRGMSYPEDQLAKALARRLIVLAGEEDTWVGDPYLRKTEEAQRQGENRFLRARYFYKTAEEAARRLGVPFAWEFATAPGIGHDDTAIAAPAAKLLLG